MKAVERQAAESGLDDVLVRWSAASPSALMVIDRNLEVIWKNGRAEACLRRRVGLEQRGSALSPVDPAMTAELNAFVRTIGTVANSMLLPTGDGHLILHGSRIVGGDGGDLIGLSLRHTEASCTFADLAKAFRLTKAEHRVLMGLLDGQGAEEIALHHKVSIETTRSQIRNIYAKLNVSNRNAMFRRILPYRL